MSNEYDKLWVLDREVAFLNHGSFGACPTAVLRHQAELRAEMEREPVRFLSRELDDRLDEARRALADFVGARDEDIAFVPNATTGVNAVVRSLGFVSGDELLTTDHVYNACRNALEFVAGRAGARVVVVAVPFPLASPFELASAVPLRITPCTLPARNEHPTNSKTIIPTTGPV